VAVFAGDHALYGVARRPGCQAGHVSGSSRCDITEALSLEARAFASNTKVRLCFLIGSV